MLGLLFYVLLMSTVQLQVANCELQNDNQTYPATSTPTTEEMLSSTTVQPSTTMSRSSFAPTHNTPSPSSEQTTVCKLFGKDFNPMFLVVGGLIIACTILILSTLVLAWKVCLLSKRVSALSNSADLVGQRECTREATVKKSSLTETEPREGSMLMADHLHEGEGGTAEEEGNANEDEAEKEEEAAKREEASPAPAEDSSSPAPQEEPAKADSTAEGTEKPKDDV